MLKKTFRKRETVILSFIFSFGGTGVLTVHFYWELRYYTFPLNRGRLNKRLYQKSAEVFLFQNLVVLSCVLSLFYEKDWFRRLRRI